jgi:hypothetical protein
MHTWGRGGGGLKLPLCIRFDLPVDVHVAYHYSRISTDVVFSTWDPPPVPQARQYRILKRGTRAKTGISFPLKSGSEIGIFFLARFHLFHQKQVLHA